MEEESPTLFVAAGAATQGRRLLVQEQSTIVSLSFDLRSGKRIELCRSADLRHLYPERDPGHSHARPCMVVISPTGQTHLDKEEDKARIDWLHARRELIIRTLQQPEIVLRNLEFKHGLGHWSQTFAVRAQDDGKKYLAISATLARLSGTAAEEYHLVMTMFPAKRSYFFYPTEELKERYMWVAGQK